MSDEPAPRTRATIAIYDRPAWWRRRRTWLLALPLVVSLAATALVYWLA